MPSAITRNSPQKSAPSDGPLTQPSGNGYIGYWCGISWFSLPFFFFFSGKWFECALSRSTPLEKKACPVSRDDLKEVYNALIKHVDKNKFQIDFLNAFKGTQSKMKDYQKQYKARRSKILKEPFTMPDAPNIVESGIAVHGQKDLQDIDMHLKFDQDDIDKYESLNVKPEFLNRCQSKEMCQNLLSWIALELQRKAFMLLVSCSSTVTIWQRSIQQWATRFMLLGNINSKKLCNPMT